MEIRYSSEVDILTVRLSHDAVDYADESDGLITHFTSAGRPVMFEIQGGREFLLGSITSMIKGEEVRLP